MDPKDGAFAVHTVVLGGTLIVEYNRVLVVAVKCLIVVIIVFEKLKS